MTTGRALAKDRTFLRMAEGLGGLGTCDRKYVGAIITRQGRCVSWGFNGAPPGLPHCDENAHGWALAPGDGCIRHHYDSPAGCILKDRSGKSECYCGWRIPECRNATHAEANALAFAARQGISTEGGTLYVTVSPCEVCARLLIAAGIVRVVYAEEYRDRRGTELLRSAGVTCCDGSYDGGLTGAEG